jgi:hypothetical protein
MVEVFKTDVKNPDDAQTLIELIHATFGDYIANFDLEDCDKILRVQSGDVVHVSGIVSLLKGSGFNAEVLSDEQPVVGLLQL